MRDHFVDLRDRRMVPGVKLCCFLVLIAVHSVYAQNCLPNPCMNGGTCMERMDAPMFMCNCASGWTGVMCGVTVDTCNPNPCQNGGMCRRDSSQNGYDCTCLPGFVGGECQDDVCSSNPCQNGGMCMRDTSVNMYRCVCTAGFGGNQCQDDVCNPNPCQNGGMCMRDTSGNMYRCVCTAGFGGNQCRDDVCNPNPCQNGGMCMRDTSGNMYGCNCPAGFGGNQCQDATANNNTTIIIVVVAVVIVVLIVALVIVVLCFVRRSRIKRNRSRTSKAERGRGQELKQKKSNDYKSGPLRPATAGVKTREFPRDKLHLFGQLGSGSFAVVYKAKAEDIIQKGTNTTVAIKMLKEMATPNDQSDFKKELHLYSMLDPHPNVLSMLGCCTDKDPMYIILEYVPHGNLQSYLRHIRTGTEPTYMNKAEFKKDSLSPTEILTFACQVVRGMEYLASKQCIHRDLATRNILLGEGLICKVSDFGLARDVAEQSQYEMKSQGRVPVRWMAPESLISNMYTSKSDVWSFGVLLWELVTLGSHPYPGMSSQKVIEELKKGYRLPKPEHCSDDIYKIMTDCWQEGPDKRPDFPKLHVRIDDLLADATGYIEMGNFNQDDYVYLEPGEASSIEDEG